MYEKNDEALESVLKSMKYAQQLQLDNYKHKELLIKIYMAIYYYQKTDTWKLSLNVVNKTLNINKIIATVVYAKNLLVDKAKMMLLMAEKTDVEEFYKFGKAVLVQTQGNLQNAAKLYIKTLTIKKFYDPLIRKMCIFELNQIFSEKIIEKVLTSKEYINEVVVILELSEYITDEIITVCKKQTNKLIDKLSPEDKLSFCYFNEDIYVLSELLVIDRHKNILKNSILNAFDIFGRAKLFDALGAGISRFYKNKPKGLSLNKEIESHKLIVLVCSGADSSKKYNLSKVIKKFQSTRINLVIIGIKCFQDSKILIQTLIENIKISKFFDCESTKDVILSFQKIRNLF